MGRVHPQIDMKRAYRRIFTLAYIMATILLNITSLSLVVKSRIILSEHSLFFPGVYVGVAIGILFMAGWWIIAKE